MREKKALRDAFGEAIVKLGERDERVVVLTGDLESSTRLTEFKKRWPERFFQLGVAEQNMVGVAAGLALAGKVPFVCSFATFLSRAWEQIRVTVCLNRLGVKLVGSHAGLSHPQDGATAQATEDVALMRSLPGIAVVVPADAREMGEAVAAVAEREGPVYLRMTREPTPIFTDGGFEIGKAKVLREGEAVSLIGAGPILAEVLKAAEILEKRGVEAEVVGVGTIKPLDEEAVVRSARKTGRVVTVEDHQVFGGVGGAVAEVLGRRCPVAMKMIGLKDEFGTTAREYGRLLARFGLDGEGIARAVEEWMGKSVVTPGV